MEYIKKIKEFLGDPKKKSLTQLGLYAIFFIFVFIFFNSAEQPTDVQKVEESKTPLEYYSDMTGYIYKVTYTNKDKIDIINGSYYDNFIEIVNYVKDGVVR